MSQPAPDDPSRRASGASRASRASRDDAVAVVRRLRESGHVAYFAGGCVRDQLLGLEPKDYDVATDAPPDRVRQLFPNTQAVGAAFGVILVRQRKSQIEVATFRTDGKYLDGRRPQSVVFTTAEEDAKRRDFTINGMFFDPLEARVIDYVGGQADLKNGVLRAIGEPNHRFEEDHLRLLRAVRFAARFGLKIEPVTSEAMARHAQHLARISPERIAEELRLMLTAPTRGGALEMISEFGFDDVIFRFAKQPADIPHRPLVVFDRLMRGQVIPFALALAAAAVERELQAAPHASDWRAAVERINVRGVVHALRQALRISNDEAEQLEGTLRGLQFLTGVAEPGVAAMKRFLASSTAPLARALLAALPVEQPTARELKLRELATTNFAPPPLVTGDDLTAAELKPGPVFKRVLDAVYDAQLEDRVRTKEEAMELALRLARP